MEADLQMTARELAHSPERADSLLLSEATVGEFYADAPVTARARGCGLNVRRERRLEASADGCNVRSTEGLCDFMALLGHSKDPPCPLSHTTLESEHDRFQTALPDEGGDPG